MRTALLLAVCLAASLAPLRHADRPAVSRSADFEFPVTFRSAPLEPAEMTRVEVEFYAEFPGCTGFFTLKDRPGESVFLRYAEQPTRRLHPAEGCYRASGYAVEYVDNVLATVEELSDQPLTWGQFRITEAGKAFLVRQCVISKADGRSYADVPGWYWQTMFSSDDLGPWLAVTWVLPE